MTNTRIEEALSVELYLWARSQLLHELAHDFPIIGTIQCASATAARERLNEVSPLNREELAFIGLRVFHETAARILGESPTEGEVRRITSFRESYLHRAAELRFKTRKYSIDRRQLAKHAAKTLAERFGHPKAGTDRSLMRFEVGFKEWRVVTDFSLRNPPSYSHSITSDVHHVHVSQVSHLPLLGIYSQSVWDAALRGDEERSIAAMGGVSGLFLDSVAALLQATEHRLREDAFEP